MRQQGWHLAWPHDSLPGDRSLSPFLNSTWHLIYCRKRTLFRLKYSLLRYYLHITVQCLTTVMNQQISFACRIKTSSLDTEGPIEVFQTTSHIDTEAERLLSYSVHSNIMAPTKQQHVTIWQRELVGLPLCDGSILEYVSGATTTRLSIFMCFTSVILGH